MTGEHVLMAHVNGKKHQSMLAMTKHEMTSPTTASGQPFPPGDEPVAAPPDSKLMKMLERMPDEPFVGIEYLIEMVSGREPRYHCCLCDMACDSNSAVFHFKTFKHRISYIDKHYGTAGRALAYFRNNIQARVPVFKVVEEICLAIEAHHGRLPPNVVEREDTEKALTKYIAQCMAANHFSEDSGPSFVHMADKHKIMDMMRAIKLKQDIHGHRQPSPSPKREKLGKDQGVGGGHKSRNLETVSLSSGESKRSRSRSPRKRRRVSRSRSRSPRRGINPSRPDTNYSRKESSERPRRASETTRKSSVDRNRAKDPVKWEKYR